MILSMLMHLLKSTSSKTTCHMILLHDFIKIRHDDPRPVHTIPLKQLDDYIAEFFVNIRKKGGAEYDTTTLRSYQSSIDCYLHNHKYGQTIARGNMFEESRRALKKKPKHLKSLGKGNLEHAADTLTGDDVE